MTVFVRDMSHFDTSTDLAGFVGATHKTTEGTSYVDAAYAGRMNAYRAAGVPVLGSYHVLHTGNLPAQLHHWLSTLDKLTPWWRNFPHWVMQIDAERWPGDDVSAATVKSFASLLVDAKMPGLAVTYASRGQYGNQLAGIATALWNAAYPGGDTYPGDGATAWAPYSGRVPVLWQYTSTPFDHNAFRGTLAQLQQLIRPIPTPAPEAPMTDADIPDTHRVASNGDSFSRAVVTGENPAKYLGSGATVTSTTPNVLHAKLDGLLTAVQAVGTPTDAQIEVIAAAVVTALKDPALLAGLGAALAAHLSVSPDVKWSDGQPTG